MTAQELKKIYNRYLEAKERSDKAEEMYDDLPDDELVEQECDKAYAEYWSAWSELVAGIVTFTKGEIDEDLARRLINTKAESLKALFSRVA